MKELEPLQQGYREPAGVLPVFDGAGVLVAGGGTAGVLAAVAAAREGADVLLVESFGALGGSATMAQVTPMMSLQMADAPDFSGIGAEIDRRMRALGSGASSGGTVWFDPEMLKFVLEEVALEAGVRLLYHTAVVDAVVRDGAIVGVIVENKAGRGVIEAGRVIDCTGDGDVCVRAGAGYESGHPETGRNQPISVRYEMAGIDLARFAAWLATIDPGFACELPLLHAASVWNTAWPLVPVFRKAYDEGRLTWEDGLYWQVFGIPGKPDMLAFNCPEIFEGVNGVDPKDLTQAQITARKAILRQVRFYRETFPGFERSYVAGVAPMVGVRESRRVTCRYRLSDEDVLLRRKFPDHVARSNYPVDVHGAHLENRELGGREADPLPWYEIPFGCLVVADVDNLLVAGRCVGASFAAQASLRVQPTVRALGEAAGIGAALSLARGIPPARIDGAEVRARMMACGARF